MACFFQVRTRAVSNVTARGSLTSAPMQGAFSSVATNNLPQSRQFLLTKEIATFLAKGRRKKKREKSGHPLQPDRFYFVKILTHFVLYKMAK